MTREKRPWPVTIVGWVYVAVGTIGFAYHLPQWQMGSAFPYDSLAVELVEVLAIVAGVFVLRGRDWARWLALGWMALHVVVSAFHSLREFAIHALLCVVIGWVLFRGDAAEYFRGVSRKGFARY
jgi:hypothetical protein